jgi:mgtE-like transporter
MIYSWKKIIRYGLPLLTLCVLIEIFAGTILQSGQSFLLRLPIFLISIPVLNSVGGNIGSILGARLASGLHVGNINLDIKDKKMHENLITSIFLGFITYGVLAIIIYYSALFSGLLMVIGLIEFIIVLLAVGLLLICIVTAVSILTAFLSFKRGLDPDDFVTPIVTTISDTMGIIFLFFIVGVVII